MSTNLPLPQYDMLTGELLTDAPPVSTNAAAMMANHADVVHVQLLDRMVVVPTAIVNVSLQNFYLVALATSASALSTARASAVHLAHCLRCLQGPLLRNKITSPDGQGPVGQQGETYLLFVDWKNFNPLLEYMCGNPVQLPR